MPRSPLTVDVEKPYHLTARTNNRDWFNLPMEVVWQIMSNYLRFTSFAFRSQIHSFVLMSNHFHLLATFPDGSLASFMQYFMRETSRSIANESGRINHIYGARYYRSRIPNDHHFANVYKYVYRNPVEAGVAKHVLDYPYSTLHGMLGFSVLDIPITSDHLVFNGDLEKHISWLNTSPTEASRTDIRTALRKETFKLPYCRRREGNPLSYQRY